MAFFRCILTVLLTSLLFPALPGLASAQSPSRQPKFKSVQIEDPFSAYLQVDPDFMFRGGGKIYEASDGALVLVGIAKVLPPDAGPWDPYEARRKGEIRARVAILELVEPIAIETARMTRQTTTLSAFFQVTEAGIEDLVEQMPVIGTWWSAAGNAFYVAVGKVRGRGQRGAVEYGRQGATAVETEPLHIQGDEPFVSILLASPLLCRHGGVRGFVIGDRKKILLSVESATLKDSRGKAIRAAQLKAIRNLLAQRQGIRLTSIESLTDREVLRLTDQGEKYTLLSEFLSIQEERVSGLVQGLPVVATWEGKQGLVWVAVGKVME